jgi:hypothetical protein
LPLPEYRKPIAKPAFVQGLDIVSSIDWMIRSNLIAFITWHPHVASLNSQCVQITKLFYKSLLYIYGFFADLKWL